ncbi:MAG: prepilin peptidase [Candidatus Levyibacteriota bacterium]
MESFILFAVYFLVFFAGAAFGSFTNVIIDRLPNKKSLLHPASHCDHCHKRIARYDLIPVVSYLLLRGRCRYCQKNVPFRVFLVELVCGLGALFLYFSFPPVQALILFLVAALVLGISLIDIDHGIIPDELLVAITGISIIFIFVTGAASFPTHVLTGLVSFLFFLGIFLITKQRGMGFGDVKYALVIGFLCSPIQAISSFYIAFLTGAVISIILVVGGIKKLKGSTVPFGPFLSAGFVLSLVFERQIVYILHAFLRF